MFRFALLVFLLTITPVASEELTIRCDVNGGPALLTFDTVSNEMQSIATDGDLEKGQIVSASDKEITFVLLTPDPQQTRYRYMREEGRIYSQNDFERLVRAERCERPKGVLRIFSSPPAVPHSPPPKITDLHRLRSKAELELLAKQVAANVPLMGNFRATVGSGDRARVSALIDEIRNYARSIDPELRDADGTTIAFMLLDYR
jgi:hypothetical protein